MTEESAQYFAYISHVPQDMAFAHSLQHYLEHYKLPAALSKKYPLLPRQVRPICRETNNIPPGPRSKLTVSRFLIVICSEDSARPDGAGRLHVDAEVQQFLADNEEEKIRFIIPVICRKGNDILACLPPSIRKRELFGIDVLSMGKERSFNDVIAAMLNVDPDLLWQRLIREEQRKRRRRWWTATGILLAVLGGIGWYVDYHRNKITYYADYVEKNNVPCGIFELTQEQVRQRQYHYCFLRRAGKTQEMACLDSSGNRFMPEWPWHLERPVHIQLQYDESGRAIAQTHSDISGTTVMVRRFTQERFIDFESADNRNIQTLSHQASSALLREASAGANSVTRLDVIRDEEGHIIREIFRDRLNARVPDDQGIWGRRFTRDSHGRVLAMDYLNREGKITENRRGVAGYRYTYGTGAQQDAVVRVDYVDSEGNPALNNLNWASVDITWNEQGNLATLSALGTDGKPCLTFAGMARMTYAYDEQGNFNEQAYFGTDGKPCLGNQGFSRLTIKRNPAERILEVAVFGTDGQPCLNSAGYARGVTHFYKDGSGSETCFYGTDGKPCLNAEGYARSTIRQNADGSRETAYFDTEGQPCLNTKGYAKEQMLHDAASGGTQYAYFGTNGELCLNQDGYAACIYYHNKKGNCTGVAFYGTNGQLCLNAAGYAQCSMSYNAHGHLTEQHYFGVDGEPCLHKDGYARLTIGYNDNGTRREEAYWGTDGNPCLNNMNCAKVLMGYDATGNLVQLDFLGTDGNPCLNNMGYAKCTLGYGSKRNLVDKCYFGVDGEPCLNTDGYARVTSRCNERGNPIEVHYLGLDGKPCLHIDGYASLLTRFSMNGVPQEESYLGVDGKPCANKKGATRATLHVDASGNLIRKDYYNAAGELLTSSQATTATSSPAAP